MVYILTPHKTTSTSVETDNTNSRQLNTANGFHSLDFGIWIDRTRIEGSLTAYA